MFDNDNKNDTRLTHTKSTKLDVERSKREDSVKCEICGYPKKYQGKLAVHCNC